jgi:tetratricopeptide (TPR) repeat protein
VQIEQFRTALKNDPKNVGLRRALAQILVRQGQLKEAQAELRQLLDLAPGDADGNYLMAQVLLKQGNADEAVNHLRATLRANPGHVGAHVLMGSHLARKDQVAQAIGEYEAALRVNPNLKEVKTELGLLYIRAGRANDAMRIVRELEQSDSKSAVPFVMKGMVLMSQQDPKGAIEAFNTSVKLGAKVDAYRGLGQAYHELGQTDRAVEYYRQALAENENDITSLNNLAWVLGETQKKPAEALPFAVKAEKLAPRSAEVLDTLGWVQYRRGDFAEAEKFLSRAAERAPSNATIQFHLGMAYASLGRKADAVSTLRRAAQLDPKLAQTEKIDELIKQLGG